MKGLREKGFIYTGSHLPHHVQRAESFFFPFFFENVHLLLLTVHP